MRDLSTQMTQMGRMTTDKKGLRHCMHTPLYRAATAKGRHPALDAGPKREKHTDDTEGLRCVCTLLLPWHRGAAHRAEGYRYAAVSGE